MKKIIILLVMFALFSKANAYQIDYYYSTTNAVVMYTTNDTVFKIMEADSVTMAENNNCPCLWDWKFWYPVDGKKYIIKQALLKDIYNKDKIIKQNNKNRKNGLPEKEFWTYKEFIFDSKTFKLEPIIIK